MLCLYTTVGTEVWTIKEDTSPLLPSHPAPALDWPQINVINVTSVAGGFTLQLESATEKESVHWNKLALRWLEDHTSASTPEKSEVIDKETKLWHHWQLKGMQRESGWLHSTISPLEAAVSPTHFQICGPADNLYISLIQTPISEVWLIKLLNSGSQGAPEFTLSWIWMATVFFGGFF